MNADAPLEAIFDTNVFLWATIGSGPAARCLDLLGMGAYTLFVSRDTLDEVQDVLSRPALQLRFPALTPESLADLLQRIDRFAIFIHNVPETYRYARDPDDEPYINLPW